MESTTILRDERTNRCLMQIDLDALAENEELLEDVYDLIAIELRRGEESVSWKETKSFIESANTQP